MKIEGEKGPDSGGKPKIIVTEGTWGRRAKAILAENGGRDDTPVFSMPPGRKSHDTSGNGGTEPPKGISIGVRHALLAVAALALVIGVKECTKEVPPKAPHLMVTTGNPDYDKKLRCDWTQFQIVAGCPMPKSEKKWRELNCDEDSLNKIGGEDATSRDEVLETIVDIKNNTLGGKGIMDWRHANSSCWQE